MIILKSKKDSIIQMSRFPEKILFIIFFYYLVYKKGTPYYARFGNLIYVSRKHCYYYLGIASFIYNYSMHFLSISAFSWLLKLCIVPLLEFPLCNRNPWLEFFWNRWKISGSWFNYLDGLSIPEVPYFCYGCYWRNSLLFWKPKLSILVSLG